METDCRVVWKLSAMAFGVIACNAIKVMMALRVGSAIAWKMSRLMLFNFLVAQLIGCNYKRNYSVSQIFFEFFFKVEKMPRGMAVLFKLPECKCQKLRLYLIRPWQ